jgi:hypothetical protein
MQLHAVIVPPPSVVLDALEAGRDLFPPPVATEEPKQGLLDRLRGRRRAVPAAAPLATLLPAAPEEVFVRLAKFGNVTATDVAGLVTALEPVAVTWRAPVLHVSAVRVAETHPFGVTAQLDGDVGALRDIFNNLIEAARPHGFFLDRRSLRSELALGSVDGGGPVPDPVAGAEAPHDGASWWPSHITLLRTSVVDGQTTFVEVARIGLADSAEELDARTGA